MTGQGTPTGSLLDAEGTRLAVKTGSTVSWLVFDLHGSVAAMCTAGTSTLTDAYRYDPFGQQIASAGSAINPYRYRGLLNLANDVGAGALLAMGARDYSPQLGTFTQEDSVQGSAADPASMNRFLYALANPATLVDPDGHMTQSGGGALGGTVRGSTPPWHGTEDGGDCSQSCIDHLDIDLGINTHLESPPMPYVPWGMEPPPPGSHWSTIPGPLGKPELVGDCVIKSNGDWDGDCGFNAVGTAAFLTEWVAAGAEGAEGTRDWASALGQCLKICTDAAARSKAAGYLTTAGLLSKYVESPIFKWIAGKIPFVAPVAEFGINLLEGEKPGEALRHTFLNTVTSSVGGALGFAACGYGGAMSAGVALAACGATMTGGIVAGNWVGDRMNDAWNGVLDFFTGGH